MAETIRVGILGSGMAGKAHATAYGRLPGVAVTALWSRTCANAEELAASTGQAGIRVYDSWQDLIERADVDVISITTPTVLRVEPFAAAVARGRHVLIEKPLAMNLAEAREIAAAAARARTVTAISLNWRYSPAVQTAWRAIREGQIGRVLDGRTEWRVYVGDPTAGWRMRPEMGGGVLREHASHEFDRLRFLGGWEFRRLVCRLAPPNNFRVPGDNTTAAVDGSAAVIAEMTDGGLVTVRLMMMAGQTERQIVLTGDRGSLVIHGDFVIIPRHGQAEPVRLTNELRVVRQRIGEADTSVLEIPEDCRQPADVLSGQHTWRRLIADFIAAIRAGDRAHATVPHLAQVSEGLRVQEAIAAAERSHAENRWVELSEMR